MSDIVTAINEHKYLEFQYEGYPRKVVPFAYGNQISTGKKVMRGLQVAGGSKSGNFDFPKLFIVSDITGVRLLEESFTVPVRFAKGDKAISPIEAEL